jgi:glutamine synthetase
MIQDKEVKFVDFRFTDPRGKWQHVTFDLSLVDEDAFSQGLMFDGSSIAGWKAINESDMTLMPDPSTAVIDPFFAQTTLAIVCDVHEPLTGQPYNRCPRSIAKAAEKYLKTAGVGDTAYFGPEAEFFVFDSVRFAAEMNKAYYFIDSVEGPYNSGTEYESGNRGHRPPVKGGYFPVPPIDSLQDMRSEMLGVIGRGPRTGYYVASKVKWVTGDFSTFSSWMQRAALGETLAHLDYLVIEGELAKYSEDGIQYYKKAGNQ